MKYTLRETVVIEHTLDIDPDTLGTFKDAAAKVATSEDHRLAVLEDQLTDYLIHNTKTVPKSLRREQVVRREVYPEV